MDAKRWIGARLAGMAGAWARERLIDTIWVVERLNSRIWRLVWWLDSHKQVEHYVDKWRGISDCSALDSDEPDEREERCDNCGDVSGCLMRGLCPMCYELNGGTHD